MKIILAVIILALIVILVSLPFISKGFNDFLNDIYPEEE